MFIMGANSASNVYPIEKSLRFSALAGTKLSKTLGVNGRAGRKFTLAFWIKRGEIGRNRDILVVDSGVTWYATVLKLTDGDKLYFLTYYGDGSTIYGFTTNRVFRDPAAWTHVILAVDTSIASQSSKRLWINGVEETSLTAAVSGYNSTNMNTFTLGNYVHDIGATGNSFDGHLADFIAIDNMCITTPTSFISFDQNGVCVPKKHTDLTYGTNGFLLEFKDVALTSGANLGLGKDTSGNSNYFNTTNFSVTPGIDYSASSDTPTNNHATLNALDNTANLYKAALSLQMGAAWNGARATMPVRSTVKTYWEVEVTSASSASVAAIIGLAERTFSLSANYQTAGLYCITFNATGNTYSGVTAVNSTFGTIAAGDTIGVAVDNNKIWFSKNGAWWGASGGSSGDPAAGTNPAITVTMTEPFPVVSTYNNTVNVNFGQRAFKYTIPNGFKSLCSVNAPGVTITDPSRHFDINTRTGTGAVGSVTSVEFTPGVVWTKSRNNVDGHRIFQRLATYPHSYLETNSTAVEVDNSNNLTSFNSNGFSFGTGAGTTGFNDSGETYVDWMWNCGDFQQNMFSYSQSFNSGGVWNESALVVGTRAATDPLGGSTATTYTEPGSGYNPLWRTSGLTLEVDQPYTCSIYAKSGTGNAISIAIGNHALTNAVGCNFYTDTGLTGTPYTAGTGVLHNVTMTAVGGGWYRCSLSATIGGITDGRTDVGLTASTSMTLWGAHFNKGASAAQYLYNTTQPTKLYVNQTAGVSIATWAHATGTNDIFSHGLAGAPDVLIWKERNSTGNSWFMQHKALTGGIGGGKCLYLNGTLGEQTNSIFSVFTPGMSSGYATFVSPTTALEFAMFFKEVAGFSKFGTYVGNGSSNGPFVYCGFKPRYLLIKLYSHTGEDWIIHDTARNTYNVADSYLYANANALEAGAGTPRIDILSNGFKLRNTGQDNQNSYSYIYMAFAEHPFGGSNVSPSPAR